MLKTMLNQKNLNTVLANISDIRLIPLDHVTNVKILEFGDIIWNYHEKYIQIGTNMPGIDCEICEISRRLRNKTILYHCMDGENDGQFPKY